MRPFAAQALVQVRWLLLLFLPHPSVAAPRTPTEVAPRTELTHPCSRTISRLVRKQLEKDILRPAQKAGQDAWPSGCPYDPGRDLWAKHEKNKSRKRGSGTQWTCGFCGKVFKNEHYLDLHMEAKHMNEVPRGGVCLADHCEMFELCQGEVKIRKRKDAVPECHNSTLTQARQRCEEAMNRCFPLQKPDTRTSNAKHSKQFCRVLDCRIREEQRREMTADLMPVVVLLILIILVCFLVFSMVVCFVDYSDDILQFFMDSGLASAGVVKKLTQAREQSRQTIGMDRTKCI